ncbi:MAG: HPF/RaiA family ribosome-associated protein [Gammaproteobacteria bacterium]|nr:HPF/RaiA family ribosome-associated protein [Gammaproteobacteria bacterium]
MQIPLDITYRHMERSPTLDEKIKERAGKLERFHDRITRCEVVVDRPHKNKSQGHHFQVRIDITVPGKEIVVSREHHTHNDHEDAYVAVRDAFDAAQRQLEDYTRKQRGDVKTHEAPPHGRVCELNHDQNYGKIETPNNRVIYFHRNSVAEGSFDELKLGTKVQFHEEIGEQGPQASSVHVVGKSHTA